MRASGAFMIQICPNCNIEIRISELRHQGLFKNFRIRPNCGGSFKAPVRPGDTITGEVEVTKVREDKPISELATRVLLSYGTVVLEGDAVCYTMQV